MDGLVPKDRAEAVAIFRAEIIGALARRDLSRGELAAAVAELAKQRFRPPGSDRTRAFGPATLQRWYYAHRRGGLEALRPKPRSDRGRARELGDTKRELLLQIRRENPSASVPTILRTLVADGRLDDQEISPQTVRRLFAEHGLDKAPLRDGAGPKTRLRWQAERPGALWHGDVCHGPAITDPRGRKLPLRVHGLLDDASRFVVALEAHHSEREVDMLGLLVRAMRRHGPPDALYLDNGSTYRGEHLRTACARLGVSLLHPRPHDPQARGKIERFWRTLREGCLDFLGQLASLADVDARLQAFLAEHYHAAPHASLLGRSPAAVYGAADRPLDHLDEQRLRTALTVRVRRRVRRDSTLPLDGHDFELDQGFLAGRLVTVARCLVDLAEPPWIEHEGKRLLLHLVDPLRNARRRRPPRRDSAPSSPAVSRAAAPFDPAGALLARSRRQSLITEEDSK